MKKKTNSKQEINDWKELTFIATFKNVEDNRLDNYYSETLYRAPNGSFILQCYGNINSKHAKFEHGKRYGNYFYQDVDPAQWLIDHNQQRLAGILFPNMRNKVEKNLHNLELQCEMLKKDEFYQYQFKNCQTKSELIAICKEANAIVGQDELFFVEAEVDGMIVLSGCEGYDNKKWEFFEPGQGNTFTGDYEIRFAHSDGWTVVPKESTISSATVVEFYEKVKSTFEFEQQP